MAISSTGNTTNLVGIVTESGQAVLFNVTNDAQYAGTITTNGNNASGTFTGYAPLGFVFSNNQAVAQFNVSGTVNQGASISGTYSGGGDQGTVSLTDNPSLYNQGSSLSSLVVTWEGTGADGGTLTFTNQSNGSFFGQSTDGCTFTGNYTIINSSFNAYAVAVSATCPNGSYSASGLVTLAVDTSVNKLGIFYGISNSTISLTGVLIQQ